MVVAPVFDDMPEVEVDVIRIPAIRHFNQTDFSMALPVPHRPGEWVRKFKPDIIHAYSRAKLPLIPGESCHPFQGKVATHSRAKLPP